MSSHVTATRRHRFVRAATAAALLVALLGIAPAAHAFGFRVGGKFQAGPMAPINLFAFGMVHDFTLIQDVLYVPMDTTLAINGSYFLIEGGLFGIRVAIPLADNKVRPGFYGKFCLKDAILFDPDKGNGFGIGGRFGGGVAFRFQDAERAELFIDIEVDVYKFLQHSAALGSDAGGTLTQINLMTGMRF